MEGDDRLQRALGARLSLPEPPRADHRDAQYLIGRATDAEAASGAIRMLIEQGYLDDARFARVFAQDKRQLQDWGSERIKRGLLGRGIDRDLVEATLVDAGAGDASADGERERALALLRRRFPAPPRDRGERERALGVLLRKGYDSEVALDPELAARCALGG